MPEYRWFPHSKYRFLLVNDFTIALPLQKPSCKTFSVDGKAWGWLCGSSLTIAAGFAWDGCSPSKLFGSEWLSAPSPASTATASLCHDFFYQYLDAQSCPWDRQWADRQLLSLLRMNKFPGSNLYYAAVRLFGNIFVDAKQNELRGPYIQDHVMCELKRRSVPGLCHRNR
jgi:hypothetical protein